MDNEKPGCNANAVTRALPSSCQSSALQLQRLLRNSRKVHLLMAVLWHVLTGSDAVDGHFGVEFETTEKFGGDEEVLASAAAVFAGGPEPAAATQAP